MPKIDWCKKIWEASVTSRCWSFTPYDQGWDTCAALSRDKELESLVSMEQALDEIPEWASDLVSKHIDSAAPCCHYLFPQPYLRIIESIGAERSPEHVQSCYAVEQDRKKEAQDYCLCLSAWLAGTPSGVPARELHRTAHHQLDWDEICAAIWDVLAERNRVKELLVERLLHNIRWQIKFCVWSDDQEFGFCRDQYLGSYGRDPSLPRIINNYRENLSYVAGTSSPRIEQIEAELSSSLPDFPEVIDGLLSWWLCAPKAFRFLESKLHYIGNMNDDGSSSDGPAPYFLDCLGTYASHKDVAQCWRALCKAMDDWSHDRTVCGKMGRAVADRLAEKTPVKRWLVRLLLRKLHRLEENGEELSRYTSGVSRSAQDGTKTIEIG